MAWRAGAVAFDAGFGLTDRTVLRGAVTEHFGEAFTGLGRVRFAVAPLDSSHALVAFVREPSVPEGWAALLRTLVALTTLLVVVAAAVAYAVARDANKDVEFVGQRVR